MSRFVAACEPPLLGTHFLPVAAGLCGLVCSSWGCCWPPLLTSLVSWPLSVFCRGSCEGEHMDLMSVCLLCLCCPSVLVISLLVLVRFEGELRPSLSRCTCRGERAAAIFPLCLGERVAAIFSVLVCSFSLLVWIHPDPTQGLVSQVAAPGIGSRTCFPFPDTPSRHKAFELQLLSTR